VSKSFTDVAAAFLDSSGRAAPSQTTPDRRSKKHNQTDRPSGRHAVEPRAGRVGVYCHLDHMQRELSRPFKVLPASLKRIQLHFGQSVSEWYNALPKAAKSGHGQLREQVTFLAEWATPAYTCSRSNASSKISCT